LAACSALSLRQARDRGTGGARRGSGRRARAQRGRAGGVRRRTPRRPAAEAARPRRSAPSSRPPPATLSASLVPFVAVRAGVKGGKEGLQTSRASSFEGRVSSLFACTWWRRLAQSGRAIPPSLSLERAPANAGLAGPPRSFAPLLRDAGGAVQPSSLPGHAMMAGGYGGDRSGHHHHHHRHRGLARCAVHGDIVRSSSTCASGVTVPSVVAPQDRRGRGSGWR
jgi:hypothetical protein